MKYAMFFKILVPDLHLGSTQRDWKLKTKITQLRDITENFFIDLYCHRLMGHIDKGQGHERSQYQLISHVN